MFQRRYYSEIGSKFIRLLTLNSGGLHVCFHGVRCCVEQGCCLTGMLESMRRWLAVHEMY